MNDSKIKEYTIEELYNPEENSLSPKELDDGINELSEEKQKGIDALEAEKNEFAKKLIINKNELEPMVVSQFNGNEANTYEPTPVERKTKNKISNFFTNLAFVLHL